MSDRRLSPSQFALLIVLWAAMLFVRFVDLHWHQHLNSALHLSDGRIVPITYMADAATPHLAGDQDHDVRLFGNETSGTSHPVPDFSGIGWIAIIVVALALPRPLAAGSIWRPERRPTPRQFRSPQLPPPLRGPPR